jgi:hypothetical protein
MLEAPITRPAPGQSIRSFPTWVLWVITWPQETLAAGAGLTPIVSSAAEVAARAIARKTMVMVPPFVVPWG